MSFALSSIIGLVVGTMLVVLRDQLGHVFSSDPAVVRMVAQIAPLVGGAYSIIGLFYASMATLDGQVTTL